MDNEINEEITMKEKKRGRKATIKAYSIHFFDDPYANNRITIGFGLLDSFSIELDINHGLFDFMDDSKKIILSHRNDFNIAELPLNETGSGMLKVYQEIYQTDQMDKKSWEHFMHITGLKKEKKLQLEERFLSGLKGLLVYDKCFTKEPLGIECINTLYIDVFSKPAIKELAHDKLKGSSNYWYPCPNTKQLLVSFLCDFFENNNDKEIKRCEHCGKWFIPDKKSTKYCDRQSPKYKNKNCKAAMILIKKLENQKSDKLKQLRRNIKENYRTPCNTYGKQEALDKFDDFIKEDNEMYKKYKKKQILKKEYVEWLLSHYSKEETRQKYYDLLE